MIITKEAFSDVTAEDFLRLASQYNRETKTKKFSYDDVEDALFIDDELFPEKPFHRIFKKNIVTFEPDDGERWRRMLMTYQEKVSEAEAGRLGSVKVVDGKLVY